MSVGLSGAYLVEVLDRQRGLRLVDWKEAEEIDEMEMTLGGNTVENWDGAKEFHLVGQSGVEAVDMKEKLSAAKLENASVVMLDDGEVFLSVAR